MCKNFFKEIVGRILFLKFVNVSKWGIVRFGVFCDMVIFLFWGGGGMCVIVSFECLSG